MGNIFAEFLPTLDSMEILCIFPYVGLLLLGNPYPPYFYYINIEQILKKTSLKGSEVDG